MSIAPLLLAFLSVAGAPPSDSSSRSGPAQLPCAVVRPVPQGPPGGRAVDPRRLSGQANRYRRGTRPAAALQESKACRPSSWSIATGESSAALSGPRSASDLARFFKTAAAKARPAEDDAGRHPLKSGDRRSGTMTTQTTTR